VGRSQTVTLLYCEVNMEKSMFETQRLRLRSCLLHVYGFFALVLRPIHVIGLWSLW